MKVIYETCGRETPRYKVQSHTGWGEGWALEATANTKVQAVEAADSLHRLHPDRKYRVIDTEPEPDDEYEYRYVSRRTSGCGEE